MRVCSVVFGFVWYKIGNTCPMSYQLHVVCGCPIPWTRIFNTNHKKQSVDKITSTTSSEGSRYLNLCFKVVENSYSEFKMIFFC